MAGSSRDQKERRRKRRQFKEALYMELREHKASFVVFSALRLLIIFCMIRQFFLGNYEGFFLAILSLLLLFLPSIAQVTFRIELPGALEIILMIFVFAAEILGEINRFYIIIPFWDSILHTLNGFLAAAVGFSLIVLLNKNKDVAFDASPAFIAIVAFCFSMTIGVLWEFFEFFMDQSFQLDMQKDTVVHTISSILLNSTGANSPVRITEITDVTVNGQSLGIGGYLDIGLIDTMKDLFVNFIGAAVFSVIGFFSLNGANRGKVVKELVPTEKEADRDYLKMIREEEDHGVTLGMNGEIVPDQEEREEKDR